MPSFAVTPRSTKRRTPTGRVRWKNAVSTLWQTSGNGTAATAEPILRLRRGNGIANGKLPSTPAHALQEWLTGFASCVQRQAFDEGRAYFHPQAYCFGSYASWCEGLDDLVEHQWRKIWPNITEFEFDFKRLRYTASRDGQWLCAMVPWNSVGYRPDHTPFSRNGRLTVVLTWTPRNSWQALHTHYSLNPGTAQTTVNNKKS